MKRLLLILFLGISAIGLGQVPIIQWDENIGGSAFWQGAMEIQQTSDGGYITAANSNLLPVFPTDTSYSFYVTKLDALGNITWQKSLGGSNYEHAYSIKQTIDGGYIVAGWSSSTDGDVTGNNGSGDYWIVKLDDLGNITWQKSLGGSDYEAAVSIEQTIDGGYIVAGFSSSSDGDVTENNGYPDYWIVKLDDLGNITWQKSLGGSAHDEAYSIQQTADGGYIIGGQSASTDGDVAGNSGGIGADYWIVRLDGLGNLIWQKSLGGSGNDIAWSIQQTYDGGYIVGGESSSNDGDVTVNYGGADCWIVKLDDLGNIIWQKSLGGSGFESAESIQQTIDGGYIVAGLSNSTDGDLSLNNGGFDYWIVKLDDMGNLLWQKSLGGSSDDLAFFIQQTTDGGYIVSGISESTDGDVSGNNGSTNELNWWIVKLNTPPNVSLENHIAEEKIEIYPNPSTNLITIQSESVLNNKFNIYDQQGRAVMKGKITGKSTQVSLSKLSRGTYSIQVDGNYKPAVIIKQ